MEPITWTSQYQAGIIQIGSDGTITVPPANSHQTVVKTAQQRGLDLINTGSTHKLRPLLIEAFTNSDYNEWHIQFMCIIMIMSILFIIK